MKKLLFIIVGFFLLGNSCKKHKGDLQTELAKLPPETQTGVNSFGCLVNGKAFLPNGSVFSGPILSCYYQYLNTGGSQGYFFSLSASDKTNPSKIYSVDINTDSLQLYQDQVLTLQKPLKGNGAGTYAMVSGATINEFSTNEIREGQLSIKKFDQGNQIVSGTFWFTAINAAGDTVKITDGRFDMHYTQ